VIASNRPLHDRPSRLGAGTVVFGHRRGKFFALWPMESAEGCPSNLPRHLSAVPTGPATTIVGGRIQANKGGRIRVLSDRRRRPAPTSRPSGRPRSRGPGSSGGGDAPRWWPGGFPGGGPLPAAGVGVAGPLVGSGRSRIRSLLCAWLGSGDGSRPSSGLLGWAWGVALPGCAWRQRGTTPPTRDH